MLIEFSVENFRSFRERQTLSLVAGNVTELQSNTFLAATVEEIRLLKVAVVYGPNASGKSNLIKAIDFMREMVVGSLDLGLFPGRASPEPFKLDDASETKPSSFEMIFLLDGIRHQYGFSVLAGEVNKEWLRVYPNKVAQSLFERDPRNAFNFSTHLKGEKKRLVEFTRPNALFLAVAAQFNHQQLAPIYEWFETQIHVIGASATPFGLSDYTARRSAKEPDFHKLVANALRVADLGIDDFEVELPPEGTDEPRKSPDGTLVRSVRRRMPATVRTIHRIPDSEKIVLFDLFQDESLGTRRFFGLIGRWVDGLRNASVVLVDELDASMHPLLTRLLVNMFQEVSTNPRNAQAIVTTHDTTLLDNSIFRRDQVWFVEKDPSRTSHLYSLQEFQPRKQEAFQKGYLAGRYGAMPFIGEPNF